MTNEYMIEYHNITEVTSSSVIFPTGRTTRSQGKLRIRYWANRTAATSTLNSRIIDDAIASYLNKTHMISHVDDRKLYVEKGQSNPINTNWILFVLSMTFILLN
ncbi:unnamed protein product [Adineta ricciae]|uniref:Uncharacterized protein n=1 Tax=Adineta ricciae TaxID=249248 RepID=A0A815S9L1_ADIRI|nr:unnamed protein product [Adineta ricciae]